MGRHMFLFAAAGMLASLSLPAAANESCEALARAAESDDTSRMAELIGSGVNVDCTYSFSFEDEWDGETITGTSTPLNTAAGAGKPAAVRMLLNNGANVNARSDDGETPLHWAASMGHHAAIRMLLSHGANVNARNDEGLTPLHTAAFSDTPAAVSVLLNHGANVNARSDDGETPLYKAKMWVMGSELVGFPEEGGYEVIRLLEQAGGE